MATHAPDTAAGIGMSPKPRAHGSELHGPPEPRRPIASDLRQEPGALAAHAGICAGGERGNLPPYGDPNGVCEKSEIFQNPLSGSRERKRRLVAKVSIEKCVRSPTGDKARARH